MDLAAAVSWLGTITGGLLLAAPIIAVRRVAVARDVGALTMTYYVMQMINCVGWVVYGVLIDAAAVVVCNVWGLVVAVYCIYRYLQVVRTMEHEGRIAPFATYCGSLRTAAAAAVGCAVFCAAIAVLNGSSHVAASRVSGVISGCVAVSMLASPLELVRHIISTRSADVLSPPTITCAIVNGVIWTFYGLLMSDAFIAVPNVIGLVFSSLLAALLIKYGATPPKPLPTQTPACDRPMVADVPLGVLDSTASPTAVVHLATMAESLPATAESVPSFLRVSFVGSGTASNRLDAGDASDKHD